MNSVILMAEIIDDPQLRFTTDDLPISEMLVEFPGSKPEETPGRLKVVGWGNLAKEIKQIYHKGDQVLIDGQININSFDRDGLKEKRAELIAQKITKISGNEVSPDESSTSNVVPFAKTSLSSGSDDYDPLPSLANKSFPEEDEINLDDIPF